MLKYLLLIINLVPGLSLANCLNEYVNAEIDPTAETVGNGLFSTTSSVATTLVIATDGLALIPLTTTANSIENSRQNELAEYKKVAEVLFELDKNKTGGLHVLKLVNDVNKYSNKKATLTEVIDLVVLLDSSRELCKDGIFGYEQFVELLIFNLNKNKN